MIEAYSFAIDDISDHFSQQYYLHRLTALTHPLTYSLTPPCSGTFECFVKKADDGLEDPRGKLVLSYAQGTTFGELALMYNTPRAATIVASSDSVLWAMDRYTFRTVILQVE